MKDISVYSVLDRLLHNIAFAGIELQKNISEIEGLSIKSQLASIQLRQPIFITSLPRTGTTLLLDLVCAAGDVATHTYRCMPFVLCPVTWDRLSRRFRQPASVRERAHGDGMLVGYDSAEGFEEVIWKAFWKDKYQPHHIDPWSATDRNPDFEDFLHDHLKKIVMLSKKLDEATPRYCSKNNANIARLPLLRRLFSDCEIVIPFRNPFDQATSMLQQHKNFLAIHARDPFALRYMMDLGHSEFGAALKPIAFPPGNASSLSPMTLEYWVDYWIRAFSWVLECADSDVVFLSYDRLCDDPDPVLSQLLERLELDSTGKRISPVLHVARDHQNVSVGLPSELALHARNLHEQLLARA